MTPPPASNTVALLRLELRAEAATVFPAAPVRALHGALHRLLETADPDLARRVHDAPVKPLTLSPLSRLADGAPVGHAVAAGEVVWARIGLLDGETLAGFRAALAGAGSAPRLSLDARAFVLAGARPVDPAGGATPGQTTYAALAAAARPASELTLRFVSPTAFRHKGHDRLQPDPRLVFGSLLRRWRAFAPPHLLPPDDALLAAVSLVDHRATARPVDLGSLRQPGFVGWARYRLDGDESTRRALAALTAYAPYAGVGARTAFGMGQTERIACPPAAAPGPAPVER